MTLFALLISFNPSHCNVAIDIIIAEHWLCLVIWLWKVLWWCLLLEHNSLNFEGWHFRWAWRTMSHPICSLYSNPIHAQSVPTLGRHHKVFSKGWRITIETQCTIQQQQQQQSLSHKICGQVWILDRLDWVIHMNSFLHSIISEVMLSFTSLIYMSFYFYFF